MRVLTSIFNFYVNASIHVAIAVCALTWITLIQFEIDYDDNTLYFVFYATIASYNFVKYFGLAKLHHRSLANWLRIIQIFSIICFFMMCYYALQFKIEVIGLIFILGIITFLYAVPLIPKHYLFDEQRNLREISGLKIYVIALVWTCTTVVIPLWNNNAVFGADVLITIIQRFLFVMVLMLPFEIRDLNYDSLKLATIPQKIGVKKTKIIGIILLILFLMLDFFKDELESFSIISTLIIAFTGAILLVFSNKKQSKYYSAFWVESLPIWWLAILLLLG